MKTVVVVGPDPKDPSRNGGIARYMEYFSLVDLGQKYTRKFFFTDIHMFSKLRIPTIGRILSVTWAALKILFIRENALIHINVTLSKKGCFRGLPVVLSACSRRFPFVLQLHGGRWSTIQYDIFSTKVWKYLFIKASFICAFPGVQTEEIQKEFRDLKDKIYPLRNFVSGVKECNKKQDNVIRFLYLGRLIPEKGVNEIVDAFHRLKKNGTSKKVCLVALGSGQMYERLRGIEDIETPGFVEWLFLEEYLNKTDIFLFPSYYSEGFPLSFLEVGARGIVPIVTENSAIPYFFKKDKEYLSVEPKNVTDLYQKMVYLVENSAVRDQISFAIYNRINANFTVESKEVVDQYIQLYDQMEEYTQ